MGRIGKVYILLLALTVFLSGCAMATIEDLYSPPKRSAEFQDLQLAIDEAMQDMEYASPLSGEHRQTVQMADLDGDGVEEYLLFARLAESRGENLTPATLYEDVWGEAYLASSSNTVIVHIANLRRKLEKEPSSPALIRTVWGKGYRVD